METNSTSWKIVHSLWVLISFIIFLYGFGIIIVALKSKQRQWLIEGVIYQIIAFLPFIFINTSLQDSVFLIFFLAWIIAIIRSFMIRGKYLNILAATNNEKYIRPNHDNIKFNNDINYNNTDNHITFDTIPDNSSNEKNNTITFGNNTDSQLTPKNITENYSMININTATADEISNIPGFNPLYANQIIQMRQSNNYVKSFDDLAQKLNLNKNELEQIKHYIIISSPENSSYRRIDI